VNTPPEPAAAVLAIDGGNSKTEAALVAADGTLLAVARAGGFTPQSTGVASAVRVAAGAVADLRAAMGIAAGRPLARHLAAYVAGADLPVEEDALYAAFAARGWAPTTEVGNDTFALLRAGISRPWGVAVVCGAGVNCAGIGPDGRRARFPSLGRLTGDWGGGHFLGQEALWHAIRGEDGRGPATALTKAVAEQFGMTTAEQVAVGIHLRAIDEQRLHELSPVLMQVATTGDPVALAVVDQLAHEVVTLARVALTRLDLLDTPTEVVLGGGVLRARIPVLMDRVTPLAASEIPHADLVIPTASPVTGAALLGLDTLRRRDQEDQ
jgi:N-acetylglucosamine kinase-like BadF-type ATPase